MYLENKEDLTIKVQIGGKKIKKKPKERNKEKKPKYTGSDIKFKCIIGPLCVRKKPGKYTER